MKIFLIYPDIARDIGHKYRYFLNNFPSLGLNYLATTLRKEGHDVRVQDCLFNIASNGRQSYSDFNDILRKDLRNIRPQVVGISFLTPTRRESLQIARLVKRILPETIVVAGGAHATVMYEQLLSNYPEIDVVVIGEGEVTISKLVKNIEHKSKLDGVKGIAFRDRNRLVVTQPRGLIKNLDSIPFPDYGLYLKYLPSHKLPTSSIVTTRGCFYGKCRFCASRSLWPSCRIRSVKNIVDEIEMLIKEYGVMNIHIHDDSFSSFPERTIQIFKEIIRRELKVTIDFKAILTKTNSELLYWYKNAGGRSIFYGLESGSQRLRDLMGKTKISNKNIKSIVKKVKKQGIKVGFYIMFGYPGETIEDISETYKLLEELKPDRVRCMLTKIYPGTQLYKMAKEKRMLSDEYWLNEDRNHRYFTYINNENEIAERKGYDLEFRDKFNSSDLFLEYDEQDIPYWNESEDTEFMKEKAKQRLFGKREKGNVNIDMIYDQQNWQGL